MLESRYPELLFLCSVTEYEACKVAWRLPEAPPFLEELEVIYLYGLTPHLAPLEKWLSENPARDLIFIEEDMAALHAFCEEGHDALFENEQIHLRFLSEMTGIENLAREFPVSKVACINLKEEPIERFKEIELILLKQSVLEEAIQCEMLHYPLLAENLLSNFPRLTTAFEIADWKDAFQGIPAIICGAGPSLSGVMGELAHFHDRALVIAGGSTITALSKKGVMPHLALALDPNPEEYERLKNHEAYLTPLIYANRLNSKILDLPWGPHGYLPTGTGGALEVWLEEQLGIRDPRVLVGLSEEALSVTSVAIMTAIFLGCNPIIFAGIDLAYIEGARYASGVMDEGESGLPENDSKASDRLFAHQGLSTTTRWMMESGVIADIAAQHPDRRFLDGTGRGIGFAGIAHKALSHADFPQIGDLSMRVGDLISKSSLMISREDLESRMKMVSESLDRCEELVRKILEPEESARSVVWEIDLEEELAYKLLLQQVMHAFRFIATRLYRNRSDPENQKQIRHALYTKLESTIADYKKIW